MTKEELKKKYTDDDLSQAIDLLNDYADYIEKTEPYATNSIERAREVARDLPESFDDLEF